MNRRPALTPRSLLQETTRAYPLPEKTNPADRRGSSQPKEPEGSFSASLSLCVRGFRRRHIFDRQFDAATIVHVQHQYFDFLTFLEDIGDFFNTLIA